MKVTVIPTHDLNRFKRDCSDLNRVGIEINSGYVKIEWMTKFKATHLNDVLVLSEQLKQKSYTIEHVDQIMNDTMKYIQSMGYSNSRTMCV